MDPTAATVAAVPAIPLPVEESRAQRLQRQQARFRDRGGIFVPSNRNTLIDILLGRKMQSPLKRRSRSLSRSPTKSKPKEFPVGGQKTITTPTLSNRRVSPRKKLSKKQTDGQNISEPIAGPSKRTTLETQSKPMKKVRKMKDKADEPSAAPKRRGRPPKAKPDGETTEEKATSGEPDLDPKPKGRKRATTTSAKPAAKKGRPRKKIEHELPAVEDDEDGVDNAAHLLTSKSTAPTTKSKVKGKKAPPLKPTLDTEAEPARHHPRQARSRREKEAYLELSDDDALPAIKPLPSKEVENPSPPVRKPPDKKGKEHEQLASVEEDSPQSPEVEDLMKACLPSKKRIRSRPEHTDDASGKDNDTGPRKRARAEPPSSMGSVDLVVRKPRMKKSQADEKAQREATSCENEALDDDGTGSIQAAQAQPKLKRTKNAEPATKKSRHKNSKSEVDCQPEQESSNPSEMAGSHLADKVSPPKKRPLEAVLGESRKSPKKRKKVSAGAEYQDVVPTQYTDPKVSHTKGDGRGTTVMRASSRKLKENVGRTKASVPNPKQTKPSAKTAPIVVPRRPPKSVLERIKEPRPQIEDDDPDPIDFLS